jgi:hypothetical protein
MKINYLYKISAVTLLLCAGLTSCNDFLDQPAKDSYNGDNFINSDETCYEHVNSLYNSPWYDFQRGFFKVGEVMSGNYYWYGSDDTQYWNCSVSANNENLKYMSFALWAVNAQANTEYANVKKSSGPSESVKNACMGECLTWKAMAYFYLVRTFGAVPIIHDNGSIISSGTYNEQYKARIENVYDYIIMTLKKAMELLPAKDPTGLGRIDKYCAEGLLAKVYLTKSGFDPNTTTYETGTNMFIHTQKHARNTEELALAAKYAKDVIDNSGRQLEPVYSDIFRGAYHGDESLIAWHWYSGGEWTTQNTLQSDLAMSGFDETGNTWGGFAGPSVDLEEAFGEDPSRQERNNTDARRKATMMMAGDKYDYFYTDCGGFDFLKFIYKGYADHQGPGELQSPTGANCVKHLVGDNADHIKYVGKSFDRMSYGNYTQLLRLADIYLIYVEAMMGDNGSTNDKTALDAFYAVRHRSVKSYLYPSSVTWEEVWKERRLELACEGDRWYDYVRWFYFNPDAALTELNGQKRNEYYGLNTLYKNYYNDGSYGTWNVTTDVRYNNDPGKHQNVQVSSFTIPFPTEDATQNPHLLEAPQSVDVTQFSY